MTYPKPKTAATVREEIAFLQRFPHFMTEADNKFVQKVAHTEQLVRLSYADLERIETLTKKLIKELV